ncbi:hypothetical protein AJ80_05280 [Polytolypa hystricis UAMH7299]|uniref:Cytosolic Fe-S cluster assembly factor NAR1 n=1 Tax=Polytolypa hystricis (strain UAMH7299) TaxID=1447883 RepID=A0A2B7Y6K7_POLH7|nr:hypothetical protein AJ80_05280 [Polytolypa hystricis UAMH7299]
MSAILSTDDLNDFITPGVACIKPIETLPKEEKPKDENAYEVTTEEKLAAEAPAAPAQISLTDCLACSGCVTSAEAVLISLQSHAEVLNTLDSTPEIPLHGLSNNNSNFNNNNFENNQALGDDGKIFVASVSPQVRASLAATYGISERRAGYLIDQFLSGPQGLRAGGKYGNGFTWVVDTNVMREVTLELSAREVTESLNQQQQQHQSAPSDASSEFPIPNRPILSSSCPGWICYAEKTHPHVLPHMSRLKSPQALTGTFLKTVLSKALRISPDRIWHLAIMPCFDKKLEASRQELTDSAWQTSSSTSSSQQTPTRDVDCVITSRELLMLASSRNIFLQSLPQTPLPQSFLPKFPDPNLTPFLFPISPRSSSGSQAPDAGTSGGYLHHLLKSYQSTHPNSEIHTQRGRNADVIEYTLLSSSGDPIIKAARYYGFRNIQNLVRKLKPTRASRLPGAATAAAKSKYIGRRVGGGGVAAPAASDYAYIEVMACPGGCTNGGGQIRVEDAREISTTTTTTAAEDSTELQQQQQQQPLSEPQSTKPTPHEQRAWLARVDEAYYSADSDHEPEVEFGSTQPSRGPVGDADTSRDLDSVLSYWSRTTGISLEKLVYTTFRKVESDVGKSKGGGAGDAARVAELAGKIGGGW